MELMIRLHTIIFIVIFLVACGGSSNEFSADVPTNSPPIVSRVDPIDAMAGDEITVFGFGFSIAGPSNIIMIGSTATNAITYSLVDSPTDTEIESLTAIIPDDAVPGDNSVIVVVDGNVSNADITLTVTE
ncbi:MAG: hypothetical protein HN337_10020 [Deltaproteobacteria bacterium]|jgi:hypothetical protein|nr:hypothetical protein [Deltaproteobacteria bacterium]